MPKSLNCLQSSPTNSSSKIHQSNINTDIKQVQSVSISNASAKNKKFKNSNSLTINSTSKRTYSSSSSTSSCKEIILNKKIYPKDIKNFAAESISSSERSAKSKAIQAISKSLNKSFTSNSITETSTKKSSSKELDDQVVEPTIIDKPHNLNQIIEGNTQNLLNSSSKKINKTVGKRRKSSDSETKEREKSDIEDINNIEISPSSKDYLNKFRKSKNSKLLKSSKISTDSIIPSKKAKIENSSLFDQPTTSKSSQKEDNSLTDLDYLKEPIANRKLIIFDLLRKIF